MADVFTFIHRPNFAMLDFAVEDSRLVSCDLVACAGDSMSGRRLRDPASDTAAPVVASAVQATHSLPSKKTLRFGASAALAALVVAISAVTFFRADMPSVAADSTLKCLDRFGHYEPCVAQASPPPSRPNEPTAGTQRPASSTTASAPTPPKASWAATALYKPTSWTATTATQQTSWTTAAAEPPADSAATAPTDPRATTPPKRATASCRRRAVACFFTALKKKLTHIATAVAAAGQPKPGTRERL